MYLFFCEQLGTFNYLTPIFEKLKSKKINYKIFGCFDLKKEKNYIKIDTSSSIQKKFFFLKLKKSKPKKIILSLAVESRFQRDLIQYCKFQKIETIGVIDFWINIKERFFFQKRFLAPDKILNIDQFTFHKLLKIGLSKKNIITVGHPFFEKIETTRKLKKNKNLVFFISQPLRTWNKKKFRMNNNFFLKQYIYLKKKIDLKLIYAVHPSDDLTFVRNKINQSEYLNFGKLKICRGVIGYYSTVIMTALLLGKPIYIIKKNNEFLSKSFINFYDNNNRIFFNYLRFKKNLNNYVKLKKKIFFKNSTKKVYKAIVG